MDTKDLDVKDLEAEDLEWEMHETWQAMMSLQCREDVRSFKNREVNGSYLAFQNGDAAEHDSIVAP